MKRSLRRLLFASLVLCAAPVLADAPVAQYQQFVSATATIRDTKTLLEWERCAAGQACTAGVVVTTRTKRTWAAASSTGCSAYGGRVPTVKELLTLVDEQPHQEYDIALAKTVTKAIDQNAFGQYTAEDLPYWSSTPTGSANERWGVSFKDGTMVRMLEGNQGYVRCVKP